MSKRLRWVAPVAGLLLVLTSCGESDDPRSGTDTGENGGGSDDGGNEGDGGDGGEPSGSLLIESWRSDDLAIWQDVLIPAFNEQYPDVEVSFQPTAPDEYDASLSAKLEGGTAGDLITCRPFDVSLSLYQDGFLEQINDLEGIDGFPDVALQAWQTDDGSETFCVPMAAVIHGYMYNAEIFDELGLEEPATEADFDEVLNKIKDDGNYAPLVMGTADQWEAATMGFQNVGPNYWNGEEGRQALISGDQKFTDEPYVKTFEELAAWSDYLPQGYQSLTYPDAQNMFTLGRGAIFPVGSWEIALFREQADFEMGIFPPPLPEGQDTCYISDHTDIGIGMNADSKNPEAARAFLEWTATAEFAELYANALPGFYPMTEHEIELEDPLAQEFLDWRNECESTIRNSYQILSRGEPNLENELWRLSAEVVNGNITPENAAKEVQKGLDSWYKPGQQQQ